MLELRNYLVQKLISFLFQLNRDTFYRAVIVFKFTISNKTNYGYFSLFQIKG